MTTTATHGSMKAALADVCSGRVSFARWDAGEGFASTAERDARGCVMTRLYHRDGSLVSAMALSARDVRSYAKGAA